MDTESTSLNRRLMLWPCHGFGGNQFFAITKFGQIVVVEEICVGINLVKEVILVQCSDSDKSQFWSYNIEVSTV